MRPFFYFSVKNDTMNNQDFERIWGESYDIFKYKYNLYKDTFSFLSQTTISDLLYIKSTKLLEETEEHTVSIDDIYTIINYAIIYLYRIHKSKENNSDNNINVLDFYIVVKNHCRDLLICKNKSYNEVWRDLEFRSLIEIIHMKVIRIKNITHNNIGNLDCLLDNLYDLINYCLFASIMLERMNSLIL
jgi:hypothetical protein